ncbi:MAG: ThiF family adenylyltransferase [Calditrichaeota bacterium]|nr:MAG: ThiF family adenylyltransferase [Calditrichota bacterium]
MLEKIKTFLEKNGHSAEIIDSRIITTHKFNEFVIRIAGKFFLEGKLWFSLPELYLLERGKYGSLAHVSWDEKDEGLICGGVSENRHIDYEQLDEVYLLALNKAIETIKSLLIDKDKNEKEILEEFSAHWNFSVSSKTKNKVISFLEPSNEILELTSYVSNDDKFKDSVIFYRTDEKNLNPNYSFFKRLKSKNRGNRDRSLYLPIEQPVLPPAPNESILQWWFRLVENLPTTIREDLENQILKKTNKVFWILSSVHLGQNKHSWFCLKFERKNKSYLPLSVNCKTEGWNAFAYNVIIHNKEYIKPRGGAEKGLDDITVAIIGCGSVGGEIAKQLASAGIGKLMLIDHDSLNVENIYRHTLSSQYIGYDKVKSLSHFLKTNYPYLKVEYLFSFLKIFLEKDYLNSVDGVIVATGNPTEERFFNNELIKRDKRPWVVYTWVEGHGIGGHAIYVHPTGEGCLSCLYRDMYGNKSLNSIQNFLDSEQDIAINIAGCGTHFLPYSFIDAIQSATLATRLTLEALNNQLSKSSRISWKGVVPPDFKLKTTYRYKNFKKSLEIESLFWEGCDVCNF